MSGAADLPPTPYQIAKAGGRHAGFLRLRASRSVTQLQAEAGRLRQRASEHQDKIANRIGYNKVSDDPVIQAQADAGRTRHLQKESENFIQQAEICEELATQKAGGAP